MTHTIRVAKGTPVAPALSRADFLDRFTDAELEAIVGSNSNTVKVFVARLQMADAVDPGRAPVVAALNKLEQVGILAAGRAAEILAGV